MGHTGKSCPVSSRYNYWTCHTCSTAASYDLNDLEYPCCQSISVDRKMLNCECSFKQQIATTVHRANKQQTTAVYHKVADLLYPGNPIECLEFFRIFRTRYSVNGREIGYEMETSAARYIVKLI